MIRRNKKIIASIAVVVLLGGAGKFISSQYRVPILMYHSLNKARVDSYAAVSPETFKQQLDYIKSRRYRVIPLSEYCRMLKARRRPAHNLVVITFDDGLGDNREAAELLAQFDFPATFFLIADKIGAPGYLDRKMIMNFIDRGLITIGSHTLTHAYLPELSSEQLRDEIQGSKEWLERLFNVEINTFAYPVGGFTPEALAMVAESEYLCACATNRGFSRAIDIYALRRIKITERDKGIKLWAKLSGFYNMFRKVKNPY